MILRNTDKICEGIGEYLLSFMAFVDRSISKKKKCTKIKPWHNNLFGLFHQDADKAGVVGGVGRKLMARSSLCDKNGTRVTSTLDTSNVVGDDDEDEVYSSSDDDEDEGDYDR